MSASPAMSSDPGVTSAKDVPQATDAYRKAHKAYVLVSGMLASWELIGITIDTKGKWGIELKSPNAVPLILFSLLFYSGYKMTVEWLQCDSARRKDRIARFDFWVAHCIALAAIAISIFQFLARIQIADWLSGHVPPQPEPPRIPVNMLLFIGVFWGVATGVVSMEKIRLGEALTIALVASGRPLLCLAACNRRRQLRNLFVSSYSNRIENFLACHARTT